MVVFLYQGYAGSSRQPLFRTLAISGLAAGVETVAKVSVCVCGVVVGFMICNVPCV